MPTPWKRSPEELHKTYIANTEAFYKVAGRGLSQELDDFVTTCAMGLWKNSRNLGQQHADAANQLFSSAQVAAVGPDGEGLRLPGIPAAPVLLEPDRDGRPPGHQQFPDLCPDAHQHPAVSGGGGRRGLHG